MPVARSPQSPRRRNDNCDLAESSRSGLVADHRRLARVQGFDRRGLDPGDIPDALTRRCIEVDQMGRFPLFANLPGSMRHEDRQRRIAQAPAGHTAEEEFGQARMAIGAHHDHAAFTQFGG